MDVPWMFHGCSMDSIVSFHGESCNGHMVKEMATTPADLDRGRQGPNWRKNEQVTSRSEKPWIGSLLMINSFQSFSVFFAVNGKSHHHNQQKFIFLRTTKGWSWWCDWVVKVGVHESLMPPPFVSHFGRQPFCLAKQLGTLLDLGLFRQDIRWTCGDFMRLLGFEGFGLVEGPSPTDVGKNHQWPSSSWFPKSPLSWVSSIVFQRGLVAIPIHILRFVFFVGIWSVFTPFLLLNMKPTSSQGILTNHQVLLSNLWTWPG